MKPFLYYMGKHFWIDFGWFYGEDFELFALHICQIMTDYKNKPDQITILHIAIAKFQFAFGFHL